MTAPRGWLTADIVLKAAMLSLLAFALLHQDWAQFAQNLYDDIDVFDDICHFVNWAMLSGAVGIVLLRRRDLPPWVIAGLVLAFGATTAILWEIGEYGAFILDTPESTTAYRDTLGDLGLGTTGSVLAGLACAIAATRLGARGRRPA